MIANRACISFRKTFLKPLNSSGISGFGAVLQSKSYRSLAYLNGPIYLTSLSEEG